MIDRQRLGHVDEADEQNQPGRAIQQGDAGDAGAKGLRAGVAHEDLGRVAVEGQKTEAAAQQCASGQPGGRAWRG